VKPLSSSASPRPRWVALQAAVKAVRREVFGFRLDYPIDTSSAAGARDSFRYYIYSDRLFFDAMVLDPGGVPLQRSRLFGDAYNPAYVAWYGLSQLERFYRGFDASGLAVFVKQVEWLALHAQRHPDGAVVWPYDFDWHEGACLLKAPWLSAMAQGLVMSALVRGYRLTGQERLLALCRGATKVFERSIDDGGLRTLEGGHALYEEYPGRPLPRVLDGFMFSLLGLYDVAVETGDREIHQLFAEGIGGLRQTLPFWDYRGKWSWYGSHGYLCPPHYNKLNSVLLACLARLTGDAMLSRYAQAWDPTALPVSSWPEIFGVFLWTKNRTRYRHLIRG
jgi:hypothetical protein